MEKKGTTNVIRWFGIVMIVAIAIGFFAPDFSSAESARGPRIKAALQQMRSIAELIYNSDLQKGYEDLGCDDGGAYSKEMENLCLDIVRQYKDRPVIHSSKDEYCAYALLPSQEPYYCIDSVGKGIATYIFPGDLGYCDGGTYLCPTETGSAPPLSPEERAFEIVTFGSLVVFGLFVAVFLVFTWIKSARRRKLEVLVENTRIALQKELGARKLYYIFVLSVVVNIVMLPVIFGFSRLPWTSLVDLLALVFVIVFYLLLYFSFFMLFGILAFSIKAMRNSWRYPAKGVCWESYLATFCLSAVWLIFGFSYMDGTEPSIKVTIFMLLMYILGFGLSVSCLLSKRGINKLIGSMLLSVFLLLGFYILFMFNN